MPDPAPTGSSTDEQLEELEAYAAGGAVRALELRQLLQVSGQFAPSSQRAAAAMAAARYFGMAAKALREVLPS